MIENTVITDDGKAARLAKYRDHLNKMAILLGDKYNLPLLSGAVKQVAWAQDIRTKFAEALDRQRQNLTPETMEAVNRYIFGETSARWWIDRKDVSFEEHLIYAKTLGRVSENRPAAAPAVAPSVPVPVGVVTIDCANTERVMVCGVPAAAAGILSRFGFSESGAEWKRDISVSDNSRSGVVDGLCLALLQAGYTARIVSAPPAPVIRDGLLTVVSGRLCVEARTEPVYKAAARLGCRRVFVDSAKRSELSAFLQNYDIEVSPEAREVLGGE